MTERVKNISAEVDWVSRVMKRYKEIGTVIPYRQEKLYKDITQEFVGGKTVIDVGCSLGIGSNILSREARAVWGIDINAENVDFAKKMFERPNLGFEVLDIENLPTKELATFEVATMIECLEHLEQPEQALNNLKKFFTSETVGFITCPNNANEEVRVNEAKHGFHIQHFDAGQFYELMTNHFQSVTMYSVDKITDWGMDNTVDGTSTDYLLLAKVEGIK